ncbi:MAG: ABC transporter substrate-binding protein [Betaproteobacteria bacterium]|nr:ABC transporter substrate-binding protein [Betaproteobacteria bacterium]
MNNRRKLIFALGAGVIAAPLRIHAQPVKRQVVVGFLAAEGQLSAQTVVAAFKQELQKFGYVEGQNLTLQLRFAEGKLDLVPGLATELVNLKADIIVSAGSVTTRALQKATSTIPVVMANVLDPVGAGLVKTLARPGGNITGLSSLGTDVGAKHLEMLRRVVPNLSRVAVLLNPGNPSRSLILKSIQSAALNANAEILPVEAPSAAGIDSAFLAMTQGKAGAVIVTRDGLFVRQLRQITELALKNRLPSISEWTDYAEAGGLMSYGVNVVEQYRRVAGFVDKILKGARPADLPVEQPTKFELVINGSTAKALRLSIPQSILISVDKVIE